VAAPVAVAVAVAVAVVGDLGHHGGVVVAQDDRGVRRSRVLARVGERLLDDPVQRQLDAAWQRLHRSLDPQLHRHAGTIARGDEVAEVAVPPAAARARARRRRREPA